ncbi:hypothetical protein AB6A40_005325 [Gnathostoma spinigerum]|uniref:RanBP2-type domain-containing protein n=1 Tax=Gnathostoma spinigerum TaxID=75299 RepID=A0ABD6EHC4_9BILA
MFDWALPPPRPPKRGSFTSVSGSADAKPFVNRPRSTSAVVLSSYLSPLSVDVTGHEETAGSGFDQLNLTSARPTSYSENVTDYTASQIIKNQKLFLSRIQLVIHDRKDLLAKLEKDVDILRELLKKAEDDQVVKTKLDPNKDEGRSTLNEVFALERELIRLRKSRPGVPPYVPRVWTCDECATYNQPECFHCRSCGIPSIQIDPSESALCSCHFCSSAAESVALTSQ